MAKGKGFDTKKEKPLYQELEEEVTQEVQDPYNSQDTQGKKGKKAERMNMAFSLSNYEFLRVMAGWEEVTITTYVNRIIEEERIRSADKYKQIKELKSTLKNGG